MKLIESENEYYLIDDSEMVLGREYNDLVANWSGEEWFIFKTNRLLPDFKQVIASTKEFENIPLLDKEKVNDVIWNTDEDKLTDNRGKVFTLEDINKAMEYGYAQAKTGTALFPEDFIRHITNKPLWFDVEIVYTSRDFLGMPIVGSKNPEIIIKDGKEYITIRKII